MNDRPKVMTEIMLRIADGEWVEIDPMDERDEICFVFDDDTSVVLLLVHADIANAIAWCEDGAS